ncbi:hypothetical protein TNCV_2820141 [Trichonephila clavipes]|nr:hypothetical protein TNCV_2820141 [Trichonephila clavipes]
MLGMAKVVFYILLSGMMEIGRAMGSGGAAMVLHLGGKFLSFLAWLRAKRLLSDWMLGTVNIDSDWLPRGLRVLVNAGVVICRRKLVGNS